MKKSVHPLSLRQKLFKSTSVVAGMTMLSRVLGFVRDMILAQIFGAGAVFDAFIIAFKIPNFMRRLFAEGAFSQAFVPILSEFRSKGDQESLQNFVNRIAGTLGLSLLFVVVLAEILAPVIIMIFAPGFVHDPVRYHLALHMIHITFPYLLLISLVAFSGAILNTFGRFSIPAFTPVLLNVSLILVAWFWAPYSTTPIYVLAWGVLIGGVAQLSLQWPYLKKVGLLPKPKPGFSDPGVRRVMRLMVPALFGVSVAQIGLLIDNIFASFLQEGSISWLYFSDRLTYLPLGVIGVSLATVILPSLSRSHNNGSPKAFSASLDWALRCVLLFGLPAAVGLFFLAGPLLSTLFQHRAFTAIDVIMTRKSLMAFSLGLPGFMLVKVLASAFYSQKNIRTPVRIAVVAMLVNLVLNIALIKPMAHAGLALATSIASLFNAVCLVWILLKEKYYCPQKSWGLFLARIGIANSVMALGIAYLAGNYKAWFVWSVSERAMHLSFEIIVGVVIYFSVLYLFGFRFKHLAKPSEELND